MRRTRFTRTAILAAVLLAALIPIGRMAEAESRSATLTIQPASDRNLELTEWAADRFRLAGLGLPDLDIHIHGDRLGCFGYDGYHRSSSVGHRIDLCALGRHGRELTLLHEAAHAWAGDNLSATQRRDFLALRGLSTWHDPDTEWEQRGTEHAASIIAWGLADECRAPGRIPNHDAAALGAGFEFLTGTDPLCRPMSAAPPSAGGGPSTGILL